MVVNVKNTWGIKLFVLISVIITPDLNVLILCGRASACLRAAAAARGSALCLLASQGGAVHHLTEHPGETDGIKTSCLIRQRAGDEPSPCLATN